LYYQSKGRNKSGFTREGKGKKKTNIIKDWCKQKGSIGI
jgi:hypothetical protein